MTDRHPGGILVAGSAALAPSLAELGLVDEYRLMVHPVVPGAGKRLFTSAGPGLELARDAPERPRCPAADPPPGEECGRLSS